MKTCTEPEELLNAVASRLEAENTRLRDRLARAEELLRAISRECPGPLTIGTLLNLGAFLTPASPSEGES